MKNNFMFEYKNRYVCGCDKISILDIENDKIVFFDVFPEERNGIILEFKNNEISVSVSSNTDIILMKNFDSSGYEPNQFMREVVSVYQRWKQLEIYY
jgi:hypothetical protein